MSHYQRSSNLLSSLGRSPMATSSGLNAARVGASRSPFHDPWGTPEASSDGMTAHDAQKAIAEPEGFFQKFGAWAGAPFYAFTNLLAMPAGGGEKAGERFVNALENLGDFITGAPTLGLLNPLRMATDREERPEFSELAEAYGVDAPPGGSWSRLAWDIGGGVALDPLTWATGGIAAPFLAVKKAAQLSDVATGAARVGATRSALESLNSAMRRTPKGKKMIEAAEASEQKLAIERFEEFARRHGSPEEIGDYARAREEIELGRRLANQNEYFNTMGYAKSAARRIWGVADEAGEIIPQDLVSRIGPGRTLRVPVGDGTFRLVNNPADYLRTVAEGMTRQRSVGRSAATRHQAFLRGANRRATAKVLAQFDGMNMVEKVTAMGAQNLIDAGGFRIRKFMKDPVFPFGPGVEAGAWGFVKAVSIPRLAYRLVSSLAPEQAKVFQAGTEYFGQSTIRIFNKLFMKHEKIRAMAYAAEGMNAHWNDVARHVHEETFAHLSDDIQVAIGESYVRGGTTKEIVDRVYKMHPDLSVTYTADIKRAVETFGSAMGRGGMRSPIGNLPGIFDDSVDLGWFPETMPFQDAPHYIPWQIAPELSALLHSARKLEQKAPGTYDKVFKDLEHVWFMFRETKDWPSYVKSIRKLLNKNSIAYSSEKEMLNLNIGDLFKRRIAAHAQESTTARAAKQAAEFESEVTGAAARSTASDTAATVARQTSKRVDDVSPEQFSREASSAITDTAAEKAAYEVAGEAGTVPAPKAREVGSLPPQVEDVVDPSMHRLYKEEAASGLFDFKPPSDGTPFLKVKFNARGVLTQEQLATKKTALQALTAARRAGEISQEDFAIGYTIARLTDERFFLAHPQGKRPPINVMIGGRESFMRTAFAGISKEGRRKFGKKIRTAVGFYREADNFIGLFQRKSVPKKLETWLHEWFHGGSRIMLSQEDIVLATKHFDDVKHMGKGWNFGAKDVEEYLARAGAHWAMTGIAASRGLYAIFEKVWRGISETFMRLLRHPRPVVHQDVIDMFRRIMPGLEDQIAVTQRARLGVTTPLQARPGPAPWRRSSLGDQIRFADDGSYKHTAEELQEWAEYKEKLKRSSYSEVQHLRPKTPPPPLDEALMRGEVPAGGPQTLDDLAQEPGGIIKTIKGARHPWTKKDLGVKGRRTAVQAPLVARAQGRKLARKRPIHVRDDPEARRVIHDPTTPPPIDSPGFRVAPPGARGFSGQVWQGPEAPFAWKSVGEIPPRVRYEEYVARRRRAIDPGAWPEQPMARWEAAIPQGQKHLLPQARSIALILQDPNLPGVGAFGERAIYELFRRYGPDLMPREEAFSYMTSVMNKSLLSKATFQEAKEVFMEIEDVLAKTVPDRPHGQVRPGRDLPKERLFPVVEEVVEEAPSRMIGYPGTHDAAMRAAKRTQARVTEAGKARRRVSDVAPEPDIPAKKPSKRKLKAEQAKRVAREETLRGDLDADENLVNELMVRANTMDPEVAVLIRQAILRGDEATIQSFAYKLADNAFESTDDGMTITSWLGDTLDQPSKVELVTDGGEYMVQALEPQPIVALLFKAPMEMIDDASLQIGKGAATDQAMLARIEYSIKRAITRGENDVAQEGERIIREHIKIEPAVARKAFGGTPEQWAEAAATKASDETLEAFSDFLPWHTLGYFNQKTAMYLAEEVGLEPLAEAWKLSKGGTSSRFDRWMKEDVDDILDRVIDHVGIDPARQAAMQQFTRFRLKRAMTGRGGEGLTGLGSGGEQAASGPLGLLREITTDPELLRAEFPRTGGKSLELGTDRRVIEEFQAPWMQYLNAVSEGIARGRTGQKQVAFGASMATAAEGILRAAGELVYTAKGRLQQVIPYEKHVPSAIEGAEAIATGGHPEVIKLAAAIRAIWRNKNKNVTWKLDQAKPIEVELKRWLTPGYASHLRVTEAQAAREVDDLVESVRRLTDEKDWVDSVVDYGQDLERELARQIESEARSTEAFAARLAKQLEEEGIVRPSVAPPPSGPPKGPPIPAATGPGGAPAKPRKAGTSRGTPLATFQNEAYEKEIYKILATLTPLQGNWKKLSNLSQILRAALTVGTMGIPNPAFHTRNMFSTIFQSMLDDQVGPGVALRTNLSIIADLPLIRSAGWSRRSEALKFYRALSGDDAALKGLPNIGQYTAKEVRDQIVRYGVVSADFSSIELGVSKVMNLKTKKGWMDLLKGGGLPRQVAHKIESAHRTAAFIKLLREGATPVDAARRVARVFVRYNYNSAADRVIRELYPFSRFRIATIPVALEEGIRRPYTIAPLVKFHTTKKEETTVLPPYMRAGLQMPIGRGEGGPMFLSGLGMVQEELGSLGSPEGVRRTLEKELFGRLHPFIKGPAEAITGRNFFFGTEAGSYRRYPGISLLGEQMVAASPISRFADTIRRALDPRKPAWARILNTLTGVKIKTVDEERELRRMLERYFMDRAKNDNSLRSFTNFYQTGDPDPQLEALLKRWRETKKRKVKG